jgi:hypothetical protein
MNTNKNQIIASGAEGTVYKKTVAVKKSKNNLTTEYNINKLIYKVDPRHISHPLFMTENHKQLYMNFINSKNLNHIVGFEYILTVAQTLRKIQIRYPSFRHNDLHSKNVVINKITNEPIIIDFGFSDMNEFPNPKVRDETYKDDWGIYPGNNKSYDIHFFLNSLYTGAKNNNKIKKLIEYLIPAKYLGSSNKFVHNFRLRTGVRHSELPSLSKIIFLLTH